MLKADFHIHTSEDPKDYWISHSPKELIDQAAKQGFGVIAITLHGAVSDNQKLIAYARNKGVLLISGIEATLDGGDILILNAPKEAEKLKTLEDLRRFKKAHPEIFIIAPHPFYPKRSIGSRFHVYHDAFDAVEYCHFYGRLFNRFNKKAEQAAQQYNKPVVGTSDTHRLFQLGSTYSLIDSNKSVKDVFQAIRKNKVIVKTRHLSLFIRIRILFPMMLRNIRKYLGLTKSL